MEVKERPILFSGPMVRAILDGRKFQTRRIMRSGDWTVNDVRVINGMLQNGSLVTPYGQVGDRLWVRETFCPVDDTSCGGEKWIDYRATPRYSAEHPAGWENAPKDAEALKWKPSIHMPRNASRLTLEITEVRVERLQDISEADAEAEGCERLDLSPSELDGVSVHPLTSTYRQAYEHLWESINGKGSWDANPWVWVVGFKVLAGHPETTSEGQPIASTDCVDAAKPDDHDALQEVR